MTKFQIGDLIEVNMAALIASPSTQLEYVNGEVMDVRKDPERYWICALGSILWVDARWVRERKS